MEQKADIVWRLRATRADMLGTDDEEHYRDCHEAADTIELLRGKLKESNAACKAFLRELRKDQG